MVLNEFLMEQNAGFDASSRGKIYNIFKRIVQQTPWYVLSTQVCRSLLNQPHPPPDLLDERLFEIPLPGQTPRRLGKDSRADSPPLDGPAQHKDGVGKGTLLGHEVVKLVRDDGGRNEQLVDVGWQNLACLCIGHNRVSLAQGVVQDGGVGGE